MNITKKNLKENKKKKDKISEINYIILHSDLQLIVLCKTLIQYDTETMTFYLQLFSEFFQNQKEKTLKKKKTKKN